MFIKVVFFFLISNVILGVVVGQLNTDPIGNPNTTLFSAQNITVANVTSSIDVVAFADEQFTPENETGIPIVDDAAEFFDIIEFLNVGELLEFVKVFDALFITNQIDQMLLLVGVEFPAGVVDGLFIIITFAGILWFLFVIFKVGASSFT